MSWLQISIHTTKDHSDEAEHILLAHGAQSVSFGDAADEPILEPAPGETPVWHNTIVTGLFEATDRQDELVRAIESSMQNIAGSITKEALAEQNWIRAWMDHFQPMRFGERLWICPWHIEPPEADAINLRLDPGMAFGTGTHPTTSLCLRWLDQHCAHQQRLLDYGCGSGVLAIAALLLGVLQADGVDIDSQALEASRLNAEANGVSERLRLFPEAPTAGERYDIVIANILSGPLVDLAPTLSRLCRPGSDIVLSGILREQADNVLNAYEPYFDMDAPIVDEDWVLLHGCRKR